MCMVGSGGPLSHQKVPVVDRPDMPGYGLLPSDQGAGLLAWDWLRQRMESARNYWLVTASPEGRPHSVPIWGVWLDDKFFFAVGQSSRKGRNLAQNQWAIIHLESGDEVAIAEGPVQPMPDMGEKHPAARAYQLKYEVDLVGNPVYCLLPQRAFGWLEADFPGTATRWRFDPD